MEKTPFPFHPERTFTWSPREIESIERYGRACARAAATECAKICAAFGQPYELNDSDGIKYEIATLDCAAAIKERFGLDAGIEND